MKKKNNLTFVAIIFTLGVGAGLYLANRSGGGIHLIPSAHAQEKTAGAAKASGAAVLPATPTAPVPNREVYYPGSEQLGPDEMRVVACGTGMPNARPKQAAACFLVELGNGDKFIFDAGLGCAERVAAMKIPYDYLE